ncbi:MAG: plasmid mobilization protein [Caulobacteraceae bacterium]
MNEDLAAGTPPAQIGPKKPAVREKRKHPQTRIQVCVSVEEGRRIEEAAQVAGMSVSAYLRALGLGYRPMAAVDLEEALKLNHLGSNLGRLGGLLKLWVSAGPRPERYTAAEFKAVINELLDLVRANQESMRRTAKGVLRAHSGIRRSRPAKTHDETDA